MEASQESDDEFMQALSIALGEPAELASAVRRMPPQPGPGRPPREDKGETFRETYFDEKGKYKLGDLSHTHEAIATWLIANPGATLRDCAAFFGYSAQWISILTNSDLFKAHLAEKQEKVFSTVVAGIDEKLKAVADIGLDKIATQMETSEDPRFLLEGTKLALTSLGFGNKAAPAAGAINAQNVQQNFYVASRADLEAARGMIANSGGSVSTPDSSSHAPGELPQLPPVSPNH